MRCFYVLVVGELTWRTRDLEAGEPFRPAGFATFRYVLAETETDAVEKAFRRVEERLNSTTVWLSDDLAQLRMSVEQISSAPMSRLLKTEPGFAFYPQE